MKPTDLVPKESPLEALTKPIEPPQSYNYGVDPNADNEVHLLDYWRAVRKRLWLVLGIVALITMLAVVYVARKPDFYEAQARVQVDLEDTGSLVNNSRPLYGPADDPIERAPDPADLETDVMMRDAIDKALASLPEELRVAVTLRDVQGLEYREIASVLDVPIGTVESRIFRGRQRLKPLLAPLRARASGGGG